MTLETWTAIDTYYDNIVKEDAVLAQALQDSTAAGLPAINVTAAQGKLLMLLAQMQQARKILEIGTLGGYSTIWLARALPADGRLVTLELSPHHAAVAQTNLQRAGVADKVEIRVGQALDLLSDLTSHAPFDFIFIDADKINNPHYFAWSLKLARQGSIILIDNVVRDGKVLQADSDDPSTVGVRRLNEVLAAEPRITATTIQTVGSKGYDGFTLVRVTQNL